MKYFENSRTYRHLQNDVVKAAASREKKLEKGNISLPSELGKLVIVVSSRATWPTLLDPDQKRMDHNLRMHEAERIKAERLKNHAGVVIRPRAYIRDMKFDFADPEVSDLCLIGHGSINGLLTDDDGKYFDWRHATKAARYLKQGKIEQRTCAGFPNDLKYPVPLGSFAVTDPTNVVAAVGKIVPLPAPGESRDHLFHPVFNDQEHILEQIEALNMTHHHPHREQAQKQEA